jgi:hypothetical protein
MRQILLINDHPCLGTTCIIKGSNHKKKLVCVAAASALTLAAGTTSLKSPDSRVAKNIVITPAIRGILSFSNSGVIKGGTYRLQCSFSLDVPLTYAKNHIAVVFAMGKSYKYVNVDDNYNFSGQETFQYF